MSRIHWPLICVLALLSFPSALGRAGEPANPATNSRARAILNELESLPKRSEKRLISGQFAGFGTGASLKAREEAFHKTGHLTKDWSFRRKLEELFQVCIDDDETPSKGIRGLLSLFKKRAVPS